MDDRSSGPAVRELPLFLIASNIISGEKRDTEISNGHSLRSFHLTILANGSLVWKTAKVNCLAKALAAGAFGGKSNGLIGRGFGTFPIKGFDYAP